MKSLVLTLQCIYLRLYESKRQGIGTSSAVSLLEMM